jgi:hypothetical protein
MPVLQLGQHLYQSCMAVEHELHMLLCHVYSFKNGW